MAGFLYFISEDTRPLTPERIRALGLGYAFTANPENSAVSGKSPNGKSGNVFADSTRQNGRRAGYYAEQQTWRKLPNVERRPELWVGYWNDAKPTPEDLQRPEMIDGAATIRFADGNDWSIPSITEFDPDTLQFPCKLKCPEDFDEHGNIVAGSPVGDQAALWDEVYPIVVKLVLGSIAEGSQYSPPTYEELRSAAISLLKANYVVDMPELVVLGTLFRDDKTYSSAVLACCRGQWLIEAIELQKKSGDRPALSTSDTSDGNAA